MLHSGSLAILDHLLEVRHRKTPLTQNAALATQNAGPEVATEWVFAHMEDADFNDPLPPPGAPAGAGSSDAAAGVCVGSDVCCTYYRPGVRLHRSSAF